MGEGERGALAKAWVSFKFYGGSWFHGLSDWSNPPSCVDGKEGRGVRGLELGG